MNIFESEFDKLLKNWEWLYEEHFKKIFPYFDNNKKENTKSLINFLKKYKPSNNWEDFIVFFTGIINFIKYLWEEHNFDDEAIIFILKEELVYRSKQESLNWCRYILSTLSQLINDDNQYFIDSYRELQKSNKVFHDINVEFFIIFKKLNINYCFIETFKQIIIDSIHQVYYGYVVIWFDYLIDLQEGDFKKYLFELLSYFSKDKNKRKLFLNYNYYSIIRVWVEDTKIKKTLSRLFNNIEKYSFSKKEINKLKDFLYKDIDYALRKYERNLQNNFFISRLIDFLYKKNKDIIFDILENITLKNAHGSIETIIIKYLKVNQVDKFIELICGKEERSTIIYFTYDYYKNNENKKFQEIFEKSEIFWNNILERNKNFEDNDKKQKEYEQKRVNSEKDIFLNLIKVGIGYNSGYYIEIFRNYLKYFEKYNAKNDYFSSTPIEWGCDIFSEKERKYIDENVIKLIERFFKMKNINTYSIDEVKLVHYKKLKNNSWNHSWEIEFLPLFIRISKILKINIKKYYKTYILYYPLLFWDDILDDVLKIFEWKVETPDIDYILRAYDEDLHNKAILLKYHEIWNLAKFYHKFSTQFTKQQNNKLKLICLDFIACKWEYDNYYKFLFVKIYAELSGRNKFRKLLHWSLIEFKSVNYFKDVLIRNWKLDEKQIDDFQLLLNINKVSIEKFSTKKDVLWRINQIKNGLIECTDPLESKYPYWGVSTFSWMTSTLEELWFWFIDERKFSYPFSYINKIDVQKEMLQLFDFSFKILKRLNNWELEWNYIIYSNYIRKIFYNYFLALDKSLIKKDFYFKILKVIDRYDYTITYNINLDKIREKFWIKIEEEEAEKILNWWKKEVLKLLKEKDYLINHPIKKNIIQKLPQEKDFVLFVEWRSDMIILENAWKELYPEREMTFSIENWYSVWQICNNFIDKTYSFMDSDRQKIFIWMLDFDIAYNNFNWFSKKNNWIQIESEEKKWLLKKHNEKKWYIFVLPIPDFRKEYASVDVWGNSLLSIELLFEDSKILGLNKWKDYKYVEEMVLPWTHRTKLYKFTKKKIDFAKSTNTFTKADFKSFKPIFELIEKIINWDYN